jgi:hypothetical protein
VLNARLAPETSCARPWSCNVNVSDEFEEVEFSVRAKCVTVWAAVGLGPFQWFHTLVLDWYWRVSTCTLLYTVEREKKKADFRLHSSWFSFAHHPLRFIDYTCEDGSFPVFTSSVTISNPDSLSSSETVVNLGIRSWIQHKSYWAWILMSEIQGIYLTKKWRAETTTWFRIWQFQTLA